MSSTIPGSIRFRLTAWYTVLIAIVFLAVELGLATLLQRNLREDVDSRLLRTAEQIDAVGRGEAVYPGVTVANGQVQVSPFAYPGQLWQVVDLNNNVRYGSLILGSARLPAAPVSRGDRDPAFRTASAGESDFRTVRVPVFSGDGKTAGAILVGESLQPLERTLNLLRRLTLIASVVGIGLSAIGGWILAGRALRPVDAVTAAAAQIAASGGTAASLATRLAVPTTGDEVARLASTFNTMLDRLEAAFASQRRFVADASHELRTPLTAIRGNVEVVQRQAAARPGTATDDLTAALDDIGRESARMARLLEDLLTLARTDAPTNGPARWQPVRLDLVANDAVRVAAALTDGQRLTAQASTPVTVAGDPDRLVQLTLILVENAIRHTPPTGEVTVQVDAAGSQARLAVKDTGEGIAPEHLPHIFERFYRVDSARTRATGGTGLGLAIAQAITRAHGGQIRVESTLGVGSTFAVTLPALRMEGGDSTLHARPAIQV